MTVVDGRLRVACSQGALRCGESIIGRHDFRSRPHYHCVHDIVREIASMGDLSIFQPLDDALARTEAPLARHRFDLW
jgi:hypothetical protein